MAFAVALVAEKTRLEGKKERKQFFENCKLEPYFWAFVNYGCSRSLGDCDHDGLRAIKRYTGHRRLLTPATLTPATFVGILCCDVVCEVGVLVTSRCAIPCDIRTEYIASICDVRSKRTFFIYCLVS